MRDITALHAQTCGCGRTLMRMDKVPGAPTTCLSYAASMYSRRRLKGVLVEMADVQPHYQIIVDRHDNTDQRKFRLKYQQSFSRTEIRRLEALSNKIRFEIQSVLEIGVRSHACGTQNRTRSRQGQTRDR